MFAQITSNPLLLHLIERKACNLIFRVNAHKHWRLLPYDYINSASKSKVLFAKLNENRGKKKHWNVSSEAILSITSARARAHTHNALIAVYLTSDFKKKKTCLIRQDEDAGNPAKVKAHSHRMNQGPEHSSFQEWYI